MDAPIEVRQLRYFVAVAEELHFGRAAERVHVSQSPLSRAIRELERQVGVVLFVRTTRRVELTPAGEVFLEHARRALAEVDLAVERARGAGAPDRRVVAIGHGPLSRAAAARIAEELAPELAVRLEEDVTPDLFRRVAAGELAGAAVMETPGAAARHRVRVDALKDEPLLAALPAGHRLAGESAIPLAAFVEECVLLPREPIGRAFNEWLRAVVRAAGFELVRTRETLSAPWDRRMSLVAEGDVVSVVVEDWAEGLGAGVVPVPLDPSLTFPIDLATPLTSGGESLARTALRLRDGEGWLTGRAIESPRV
jgi:DNA-binding transcriptional LysR family regulator